jgi:hypothetical protein
MIDKRQEFLDVLFDFDDKIAFGMDDGSACKPIDPLPDWLYTKANKFCINPLRNWRDTGNVTAINSFLFEIDKDADGNLIPVKQQVRMFLDSGLPYTTMVYSGTKSVHCIVRLTEPVEQNWFSCWWEAIDRVLTTKGLPIDPATMKIPQLSRVPGSIRMDKVKDDEGNYKKDEEGNNILLEGNEQKLIHINRRIEQSEIKEWLATNGEEIREPWVPPVNNYEPDMNAQVDDKELWQAAYNMNAKKYGDYNQGATTGNWVYLIALGNFFYRVDLAINAMVSISNTELGSKTMKSSGEFFIEEALTKGWKWAEKNSLEKIPVQSKADWVARQKENKILGADMSDILKVLDEIPEEAFNGEIADLNASGLAAYIRVGTKYYRADDHSIDLWDKGTINDDFGRGASTRPELRKYRGFTNEPNYLKRITHVSRRDANGEMQSYYNKFFYPNFKFQKGTAADMLITMHLLKKVFSGDVEDQLEIGLDWIQILLTNPKQKLRALTLLGPSETGKDTFMEWLIGIVGVNRNGILLNGEEIESNFNSGWIGKHVVCLNEVSYDLADKKTKERIKNLLTADRITVEGKGENQYQIENYNKLVMATNNIYDFMKIDNTENRFWLRMMASLKESDKIDNFVQKLKEEAPYFINWIVNERQLYRKKGSGRFWHTNEEVQTRALTDVVENTKTSLYSELLQLIEDKFNHPKLTHTDEMHFRYKSITQTLQNSMQVSGANKHYNQKAIKMCLLKEFALVEKKTIRHDAFEVFEESNNLFFTITREQVER